ncbi:YtxH domain-containing protein [Enterococcus sp. 2201sp1_2201st1_B8_2201SCRN_220225]|uniref:YtxH domain-containing protein n=1 Tax=unclassified Enterococcus TaxID=2608891 RepID=UPI0034A160F8
MNEFLKGLLFGSAVGGSAGLLLAPRSGNDTRKKLQAGLEEATATQEDLNQSLERFSETLKTTQTLVGQLIPEFQTGLQKDIEAFQFQAEPRMAQIKKQAEVIESHLQELEAPQSETKLKKS